MRVNDALSGAPLVLFRGGKPASSLVIALLTVLAVDYVFTRLLLVPLPLGEPPSHTPSHVAVTSTWYSSRL